MADGALCFVVGAQIKAVMDDIMLEQSSEAAVEDSLAASVVQIFAELQDVQ
ncbi:hypothetical protein D3C72_2212080 [compost metagenome]